jgi:hypothetical protein
MAHKIGYSEYMSEIGGGPEFVGPQIEQMPREEKVEIAGDNSKVHPEVARILQRIDRDLKTYEEQQGLRNELGAIESFANKPPEIDPLDEIREVDRLPQEFSQTSRELIALAEIPHNETQRAEGEPLPEPTSEEMIEIYESITTRLEEEPEAAKLEALMNIIDSEIALNFEKAGVDENFETIPQNYNIPYIEKLNKLKISKETLVKMIKGEKVSSTSAEAQAVYQFVKAKMDLYDIDDNEDIDPEIKAMAGAGYAFFESLYDQFPEDAYDEEDEDDEE